MYHFEDWSTADVAVIVRENSLNKLFKTAAKVLENYMVGGIEKKFEKKFELSAKDLRELLFLWLNELIYEKDSKNMFFKDFKVKIIEDKSTGKYKLNAIGYGEKFDKKKHEPRHDVKSCTYHKLEVKKKNEWTAQVVLDI